MLNFDGNRAATLAAEVAQQSQLVSNLRAQLNGGGYQQYSGAFHQGSTMYVIDLQNQLYIEEQRLELMETIF
jgi:hypothetical protein